MTRRTRFMSLAALALSLAFLFVADFRQALSTGLGPLRSRQSEWFVKEGTLSVSALEALAATATEESDALTLGFVALQHSNPGEQERFANQAIDLDSELTWLLLALRIRDRDDETARDWLSRLQEWEPDNAVLYHTEADWRFQKIKGPTRDKNDPAVLQNLSEAIEWRNAMERAFAATTYDAYHDRLYDLLRAVMQKHGIENPATLVAHMAAAPIPNLMQTRAYANLVVFKLAKEAEQRGNRREAMRHYRSVLDYGQRMRSGSTSLIGRLIGIAVIKISAEDFISALRRSNRADEANSLELRVAEFDQRRRNPYYQFGKSSHMLWNAVLMILFSSLVVIFGILTLVNVGYVNAKRWYRSDVRGKLFETLTIAENYTPLLLFASSLALYVVYYPYAVNFRYYMSISGAELDFEVMYLHVLPTLALSSHFWNPISPGNPFFPYVTYAIFGLVALPVGIIFLERKRLLK